MQLKQYHPHLLECNLAGSNDQHQHRDLVHQEEEELALFLLPSGRHGMMRFVGACLVDLSKTLAVARNKTKRQMEAVQSNKTKRQTGAVQSAVDHIGQVFKV